MPHMTVFKNPQEMDEPEIGATHVQLSFLVTCIRIHIHCTM